VACHRWMEITAPPSLRPAALANPRLARLQSAFAA
jgi:hypothetical protein